MGFRNRIVRLSQLFADTITGGTITGATINAGTITGAIIQTATNGARWVFDNNRNRLTGYTGDAQETTPGTLEISSLIDGVLGGLVAMSPSFGGSNRGTLQLTGNKVSGLGKALLGGDEIDLQAPAVVIGDLGGDAIRGFKIFDTTINVAAASGADLAIAHGMGVTPKAAFCVSVNVTTFYGAIAGVNNANITARVRQQDGTAVTANVRVFVIGIW